MRMLTNTTTHAADITRLIGALRDVRRRFASLRRDARPFAMCMVHSPAAWPWDHIGYDHTRWPDGFSRGLVVRAARRGQRLLCLRTQRRFRLACRPRTSRRFVALCHDAGHLLQKLPKAILADLAPAWLVTSLRCDPDDPRFAPVRFYWLAFLFEIALAHKGGLLLRAEGPFSWETSEDNGKGDESIRIEYKSPPADFPWAAIIHDAHLASERAIDELIVLLEALDARSLESPATDTAAAPSPESKPTDSTPTAGAEDTQKQFVALLESEKTRAPFPDEVLEALVTAKKKYKEDCRKAKPRRRYKEKDFADSMRLPVARVRSALEAHRNRQKRKKIKKRLARVPPEKQ